MRLPAPLKIIAGKMPWRPPSRPRHSAGGNSMNNPRPIRNSSEAELHDLCFGDGPLAFFVLEASAAIGSGSCSITVRTTSPAACCCNAFTRLIARHDRAIARSGTIAAATACFCRGWPLFAAYCSCAAVRTALREPRDFNVRTFASQVRRHDRGESKAAREYGVLCTSLLARRAGFWRGAEWEAGEEQGIVSAMEVPVSSRARAQRFRFTDRH